MTCIILAFKSKMEKIMKLKNILVAIVLPFLLSSCMTNYTELTATGTLSEVQKNINSNFERFQTDMSVAAAKLSDKTGNMDEVRGVLASLKQKTPLVSTCSFIDRKGIMKVVEPVKYRKYEGSDISSQEQVVRVARTQKPVLSNVFRSVEGFYGFSFLCPVMTKSGAYAGSISFLVKPETFFRNFLDQLLKNRPVEIWVMDKNGFVIYDRDRGQIGRNIFKDDMYKPFPALIKACHQITGKPEGTTEYEFYSATTKEKVLKKASWTTLQIYGVEWKLVHVELNTLNK